MSDTVENLTLWTSEHAVDANAKMSSYRVTMAELAEFCVDAPDVELKQVALELKGAGAGVTPSSGTPADTATSAPISRSRTPSVKKPALGVKHEDASGVDYSA